MCILDHAQGTFFCLGKFLKKLPEDEGSSITKWSIYYIIITYNVLAWAWIDQKYYI